MNRTAATLLILGLFSIGVITSYSWWQFNYWSGDRNPHRSLPTYTKRVQALVVNPNHPWISKIVGAGLTKSNNPAAN